MERRILENPASMFLMGSRWSRGLGLVGQKGAAHPGHGAVA